MTKQHVYSKAFKLEAVRLLVQADKPVTQIAKELGVRRTLLYSWRDAHRKKGDAAFPGSGRRPACEESELIRLRRELKRVTQERDILKKRRRTSPKYPSEVRLYWPLPTSVPASPVVPYAGRECQWLLRLVPSATQQSSAK